MKNFLALILIILMVVPPYALSYTINGRVLFDKSVAEYPDGTNPTGHWLIDRIAGNSWGGTVPAQGAALEAGGVLSTAKALETPEGIYVVVGMLGHTDTSLYLLQDGMLRLLMESEGDDAGPIEMCRAGYPVWSELDNTVYLTGENCLRKIEVAEDGTRSVAIVAGTCGSSGKTNGGLGTGLLQHNSGLAATSDGIIYWLETDALRKIDTTADPVVIETIDIAGLTWVDNGQAEEPSPYWVRSGLNDTGLSLGATNDILYVHDYWDGTYGNGLFEVNLASGTIEKVLNANGVSNTYWQQYDIANGTSFYGQSINDAGPVGEFVGLSAGRYSKFYNSLLIEYNDDNRLRWYNLDDAANVTTIFGTPTNRVDGVLTGGGEQTILNLNAIGVPGESFYSAQTTGYVDGGEGKGIYFIPGSDKGLFRAYDSNLTTEGGATFKTQFPDTSVSSSRDARVKAAIVKPDGTFLNTSFAVSSLASGVQSQPKVAYLNGVYLVVWAELGNDSEGFNVYGMRISNTGSIIGSKITIADGLRTQTMPDVSAGSTDFMVVWGGAKADETYADYPQTYIWSRTIALDGTPGTAQLIDEGAAPEIAWNATAGKYLVVYTTSSESLSTGKHTRWVRLNADGTAMVGVATYPWFYPPRARHWFSVGSIGANGWTLISDFDDPDRHDRLQGRHRAYTIDTSGDYDSDLKVAIGSYLGGSPSVAGDIPSPLTGAEVIANGSTPPWYLEYVSTKTGEWPKGPGAITSNGNDAIAVWQMYDVVGDDNLDLANGNLYIGQLDKFDLVEASKTNLAVTADSERHPSIAGDDAGNLVVVYEKILDGERQIASKSVDVATPIVIGTENVLVSESLDSDLWRGYPDITYNATDDNYLLVWQEGFEGLSAYSYPEEYTFTESTVLTQDGWPTPEQIAIFLPDNGVSASATATMRYKKADAHTWTAGHDLYHINDFDGRLTVEEGFAWVITGLEKGTDYVVEVTTHDGATDVVYAKTMSTSSLPPAAGAVTKTIAAGSTEAQIEAIFASAIAGDVIQFEDGTYTTTTLTFNNSAGTEENPIYVRGESRDGVIVHDPVGTVFTISSSDNLIVENMTFRGVMVDNGISVDSKGIGYGSAEDVGNITLRYLTVEGVDIGFWIDSNAKQLIVYENLFTGNHTWDQDLYSYDGSGAPGAGNGVRDQDENIFWNDTGIKWGGNSNVAFNNTFGGFGDTMKVGSGSPGKSIHFYRNNVNPGGDDGVEFDDGWRNITAYDNRITNTATCVSVDAFVRGGPAIAFRNTCINISRQIWKLNVNFGVGFFLYNNTIVHKFINNYHDNDYINFYVPGKWQNYFGFQNNIMIYHHDGVTQDPTFYLSYLSQIGLVNIDYTNNSWYPDGRLNWNMITSATYDNLADAYANVEATIPVFSGETQRHTGDIISELQPFTTPIVFGDDYTTEVTVDYTPTLTAGGNNVDAGVEIVGITPAGDSTPNIGAIMDGFNLVTYGATIEVPAIFQDSPRILFIKQL